MSFPKIVNQMGSFGENRKKMLFHFCRPILDIFGFPLLNVWHFTLVWNKEKNRVPEDI